MLQISNLQAKVEDQIILKGIDLSIKAGEVHVIMGPNGAGKSTLSAVLTGKPGYEVTEGQVTFEGENLLELEPEERAHKGLFMAFQYPVEIPGVSTTNFLKEAINQMRETHGEPPLNTVEFIARMKEKMKLVNINQKLLSRSLNEGFSGGEKKRNEIFQMAMLDPKLAILDETDSGLDIDALKIVGQGLQSLRTQDNAYLIITHYPRLLEYIQPDYVHVLSGGKIIKSGDQSLAAELEQKGYDWIQ